MTDSIELIDQIIAQGKALVHAIEGISEIGRIGAHWRGQGGGVDE
jgi:hypothetical protein